MKSRKCADANPKIITRIYDWDGKQVEISLCKQHSHDPDFDHFVMEEKI